MTKSQKFYCRGNKNRLVFVMVFMIAATVTLAGCRSVPQPSDMVPTAENHGEGTAIIVQANEQPPTRDAFVAPNTEADKRNSESPFPTFKETDIGNPCTDDSGRPLIILFSASSCPHCQWVGGVFDLIAREYVEKGLIAAHHYDIETKDDLLTGAVETRIPEEHLSIGKRGDPDGYLPYFNFGCRYDRIGTGYEKQNDLSAEAEEMCRVIESLLP